MEWAVPTIADSRPDYRDGCIHHRLGCLLPGSQDWGIVVGDREIEAYKLSGTASSRIRSFATGKENICIHLKMDNTTALTYINKFRGTVSQELNQLTKDLWLWCLDRNITLHATHLQNVTADEESRVMKDRTDWARVFSEICHWM